jgi:hypothetical protein
MANKSNNRPNRSKPYALKMAEKSAAKRAMRGNKETSHDWVRPQDPRPAQNSRIDQPSEHIPE